MMHNEEYYTIAELEDKHWWYRSLHALVLSALDKNFNNKNIQIIDAGCGTGGLMTFLKNNGYGNVRGFDISEIAVKLCSSKGLDVFKGDLKSIAEYFPLHSADVVISNDTFYFLDEAQRRNVTDDIYDLLRKNGLLILNIPSLKAFSGLHDRRVGIKSRFNMESAWKLFDHSKYKLIRQVYWPFLISPFIWLVRYAQRVKLKFNKSLTVNSDLKSEGKAINSFLYKMTSMENRILPQKPFGSSLFLVAKVNRV